MQQPYLMKIDMEYKMELVIQDSGQIEIHIEASDVQNELASGVIYPARHGRLVAKRSKRSSTQFETSQTSRSSPVQRMRSVLAI